MLPNLELETESVFAQLVWPTQVTRGVIAIIKACKQLTGTPQTSVTYNNPKMEVHLTQMEWQVLRRPSAGSGQSATCHARLKHASAELHSQTPA